jgi:NitT/TauT family transport system permease protein
MSGDGGTDPAPVSDPEATSRAARRHPSLRIGGDISVRLYVGAAALTLLLFVAVWWLAAAAGITSKLFLPSPVLVVERLGELAIDGTLWEDVSVSFYRILVGFTIASVLAIPLGVLIGTYRLAEAILEPFVDFVRYMPVVGFVPLTIVWIGIDDWQKFSIVFIGTFFQQVLLVMDNVKRVPHELVDVGRTLGMRDVSLLSRIIVPSAAPAIWDTMRISLGWAWTWIVLAELVAATSGLGYRITVSQRYFQTETILGYLVVLGILGLITDQLMKFVGRAAFRWSDR